MTRRLLVCGGRNYADALRVIAVLDALRPVGALCTGGAGGADALAFRWAIARGIDERHIYPADWNRHGRAAGPIRNTQMLADFRPDLVVAFPGGRGTADMVQRARAAGVAVQIVAAEG